MLSILLTCIASAISSTTLEDILTKLTLIDFVCFSNNSVYISSASRTDEDWFVTVEEFALVLVAFFVKLILAVPPISEAVEATPL